MVFQRFVLKFDTLTAAENVWLGLDKSWSLADVTKRIVEVAGLYGLDVDPLRPVHTLSVGERQRVEIVRALLTKPRLLIRTEPTSVPTPQGHRIAGNGSPLRWVRWPTKAAAILYLQPASSTRSGRCATPAP